MAAVKSLICLQVNCGEHFPKAGQVVLILTRFYDLLREMMGGVAPLDGPLITPRVLDSPRYLCNGAP